jgi:hypothetical protein
MRIVRPSVSFSLTKSADQQSFGRTVCACGIRCRRRNFIPLYAADLQVLFVIEAVDSFGVDLPSFPFE